MVEMSVENYFLSNLFNFNLYANLREYCCQGYDEVSQNVHIHGQHCISFFRIHDYINCSDRNSEEDIKESETYVEHSLSLTGFKNLSTRVIDR